ncbi:hypothetical protein AALO_G00168670 [Alosa alosa]|uniref:ZP domain-containing protein n=1 Tax=Alosa alosa TaxID=278164 RepID=A0AAV6GCF0_9TELE|nr:hypothetical protein AALO_G00168670 [Alosa alosa]
MHSVMKNQSDRRDAMLLFVGYTLCLVTPLLASPVFDPCHKYTTLDEPWRATNYTDNFNHCDSRVSWDGWYRLLYHGQTIRMPEECLRRSGCGTAGQLWMNGTHPQLQDGIVTRKICKALAWRGCCFDRGPPIQVKACPGNYYVYQFVQPNGCNYAYCADVNTISTNISPTSATVHTSTVSTNPCGDIHCTEDEVCGEVYGIYGCLCKSHHQPIPESFGLVATCHNSSCWISLSRCLLFEAGFPAQVLHLNDPGCTGTVLEGQVKFHFNNDDQKCGTVLRVNKTHFIYENSIQGTADSAEGSSPSMGLPLRCTSTAAFTFALWWATAASRTVTVSISTKPADLQTTKIISLFVVGHYSLLGIQMC